MKKSSKVAVLPASLQRTLDTALASHRSGDVASAVAGYRQILTAQPRQLEALLNLGAALASEGKPTEATRLIKRAREVAPRIAQVHLDAGICFRELGRWDDARDSFQTAARLDPSLTGAWTGLGDVLIEVGREREAIEPLQRAGELDPWQAKSWFWLHKALFDEHNLTPAIDALCRAVAIDPGFVWGRFALGVALALAGKTRDADLHFGALHPDKAVFAGAVDSWRHAQAKRTPGTRFFASTRRLLRHALEQCTVDGLSLEFGVRYGVSARWFAEATHGHTLHGFDSFQGLPEDWHIQPKNIYSTHGEVPEVPASVKIHVGLFEDTLAPFAAAHPGPIRFANIDCDIYSATRTVLETLADRIVPGTVLVFDEYLVNDRWRDDEFKAFQEAVARHGWSYEYLAFSLLTGQASVVIR